VKAAQAQGKKWQKAILYEKEQRLRLEKVVEELAKQHTKLEEAAAHHGKTHYLIIFYPYYRPQGRAKCFVTHALELILVQIAHCTDIIFHLIQKIKVVILTGLSTCV